MTQVLNCKLTYDTKTSPSGRKYQNLYLTTENGTSVQIKVSHSSKRVMAKLNYKLVKEIDNAK